MALARRADQPARLASHCSAVVVSRLDLFPGDAALGDPLGQGRLQLQVRVDILPTTGLKRWNSGGRAPPGASSPRSRDHGLADDMVRLSRNGMPLAAR